MDPTLNFINLLRWLCNTLMKKNSYFLYTLTFSYYMLFKLEKIKNKKFWLYSLCDKLLHDIVKKHQHEKCYIDAASCALVTFTNCKFNPMWISICSRKSNKKYKIFMLPFDSDACNEIYVSETMLFNITNLLSSTDDTTYFLMPSDQDSAECAEEVIVSLLSNPYECPENLTDASLKNYFSSPRYLRKHDIIQIDIKEWAPEYYLTIDNLQLKNLYFKVNDIKIHGRSTQKSCYVYLSKTTLIQEPKIGMYFPPRYFYSLPISDDCIHIKDIIKQNNINNFPLISYKPLEQLKASIRPFLISDDWKGIKPIFLVKGPSGCGKYKLIKTAAQQIGLNFYNIDCSEIQTLSASQTEIKLRIIFNNAKNFGPGILKISNIQIFGKDAEGSIDERLTSNFTEQINNLYKNTMKLPLIIVATSEGSDIPADINRNFLEQIQIDYLAQDQRINLIVWLLKIYNMKSDHIDISKIASCSDFVYQGIENLVLHAVKNFYKRSSMNTTLCTINDDDFINAYDYMQSMFSNQIGAPKCPEVYWKDIGGLANLKYEIIRRIEVPLIHKFDIQSSGILLYGPPGTGKTLLAKAVATECKIHFLSVKGPELLNMYVGQSEKNVRDLFERARAASPCIIFFDELDALAPNRGRSGDSGGVMDRVVSQLLAEMDGLGSSTKTFIIGATNRPDLIDPALLRPGRFDKLLYIGIYSDAESQLSVLKAITRQFSMEEGGAELEKLIKKLPSNLTGADLHAVCSNAWLNAARRVIECYEQSLNAGEKINYNNSTDKKKNDNRRLKGPIKVTLNDFLEAIQTLVPSVSGEELERYDQLHRELTHKILKS